MEKLNESFAPFMAMNSPFPFLLLLGTSIFSLPERYAPVSNPATYTGVFDDIRNVFAEMKESKIRGYDKSRFSFNVKGGRFLLAFSVILLLI